MLEAGVAAADGAMGARDGLAQRGDEKKAALTDCVVHCFLRSQPIQGSVSILRKRSKSK